jgi:hypothetical protein
MKVYIGGYPKMWDTKSIEHWWYNKRYNKFEWQVESPDRWDDAFERVIGFWQGAVCRPINSLKSVIPRTQYIKVDPYDSWSADHTLAFIIVPVLKQLKANKHGAPFTDDADAPEYLRSTNAPPKENEWDTDEFHFQRWDWMLDEIIWTFEQFRSEDDEAQFYIGDTDFRLQGIDAEGNRIGEPRAIGDKIGKAPMYELVKGSRHSFYIDNKALEEHRERIANGLRLFGKYYRALWD